MQLFNFINQLPEGTSICIGAASGWMYFGSREEWLSKYKEMDSEYFEKTKLIYKDAKRYLHQYLPSIKPKMKTYKEKPLRRRVRSEERNEQGLYEFHLEDIPFKEAKKLWECKYSQAEYNFAKWKKYWNNYIKLSQRSVLKAYRKEVDEGVGIIIPGCENGNYWLRSEWEAENKE